MFLRSEIKSNVFIVKIRKGKVKETIATWRKEWEVRLEVEVTKKSNESLTNIVHFTTGLAVT